MRDGDLPKNLEAMYIEAAFGDNEKVENRIRNRIYSIGRNVR